MEQRTLRAAFKFYCDKDLEGAHEALPDTLATVEVFLAQLERYKDKTVLDSRGETVGPVPSDMEELGAFCKMRNNADLMGRLVYDEDGHVVFQFGKHSGKRVKEVLDRDPGYFGWMMQGDFPTVHEANPAKGQRRRVVSRTRRIAVWVSNDLTFDQRVKKTCQTLEGLGWTPVLVGREMPNSVPWEGPWEAHRLKLAAHAGPRFYLSLQWELHRWLCTHASRWTPFGATIWTRLHLRCGTVVCRLSTTAMNTSPKRRA